MSDSNEKVLSVLSGVVDPEIGVGLVENGLIQDVKVDGSSVELTLVSPVYVHPGLDALKGEIVSKLEALDDIDAVTVNTSVNVATDHKLKAVGTSKIKNLIAVASGKGGVGKSTVSVNLAVMLAKMGAKVGLMDADVYGPNIPMMMGVERLPAQAESGGIAPAEAHGVKMISIGFMVKPGQPIVWRGPMLHSAIQQFLTDVQWGELDYLVVDLPPGTGDVQLSLAQTISITGGVIVTLPQLVSLDDARRGLEMFRSMDIPIMGVVENMSYLELPSGEKMDIFGTGGGEKMAGEAGVEFLGGIPMDPAVREGGDSGKPIVVAQPDSAVAKALEEITVKTAILASKLALASEKEKLTISLD